MSLQPQAIPPIPEETARIAHAILPKGNTFIRMRDEFGTFFRDEDFLDLFSEKGQPAESAWRLALVMVMQYAEGLTDRQAVVGGEATFTAESIAEKHDHKINGVVDAKTRTSKSDVLLNGFEQTDMPEHLSHRCHLSHPGWG